MHFSSNKDFALEGKRQPFYHHFIFCYLIYGIHIYYNIAPAHITNPLFLLHKRAFRLIAFVHFIQKHLISTQDLSRSLNLLPLPQLASYFSAIYGYEILNMLAPDYVVYTSPYRWSYYPRWWNPWNQFAWHLFHPRVVIYHSHYHVVHYHRLVHVHHFYRPYRSYSHHVLNHCNQVRVRHGHHAIHRAYASGACSCTPSLTAGFVQPLSGPCCIGC